jgi:hypothetical protein
MTTSSAAFRGTIHRIGPKGRGPCRSVAALGLVLSAGLALTACGGGSGTAASATSDPSSDPAETVAGTAIPTPTVTASVAVTETATSSPTGDDGPGRDALAGPTQTYTTESGAFTWTIPETWTASQEDYNEDLLDYHGVPYEEVLFQDPEQGVEFRATTGVGATDNDGPKPDVVEVLDAQELPGIPVKGGENAIGAGPGWYRAALLRANDAVQDSQAFDGQEFLLSVQVVNVPEGADPQATDDSFWTAWFYEQAPATGFEYGTASFLAGTISQDAAEKATGLDGEEALRAVVATQAYAELRDVATSLEVTAP